MADDVRLETIRSKWGKKPQRAPLAAKPEPEPVVSSSAEHAPVEASAAEYDGVPLSLVLARHLERLKSSRSA